jgi:hypothetical protein
MERPSRGGEKRTTVWASHYEERGSDGAGAPPMCDHRVVLQRCVGREWFHPAGAAVAPGLHAAARTRRAARAVQDTVVSGWPVLPGTPNAPPIPAQRVARFDGHCTRNCLLQNKLRQRYSRYMAGRRMSGPRAATTYPAFFCAHRSRCPMRTASALRKTCNQLDKIAGVPAEPISLL